MRVIYFDLYAGVAGDMVLGTLLDLGLSLEDLRGELAGLPVSGYRLEMEETERSGLRAVKLDVRLSDQDQPHRRLGDILEIIGRSKLGNRVKDRAESVFRRLAEAEARVHGTTPEEVHFHEVGSVDAIVDVVGSCIGLEALGVEEIYASGFRFGRGRVKAAHGVMPVPVPAVVELTRGLPVEFTEHSGEMVTPTGASIITGLAKSIGAPPPIRFEAVGHGAGSARRDDIANVLRAYLGETVVGSIEEQVMVVETNIDDMNPEIYGHLMDLLFESGTLDVYLTPVQMKKNRPATCLTVLVEPGRLGSIVEIIGRETTTLGLRTYPVRRFVFGRRSGQLKTEYGTVQVKEAWVGDELRGVTPEYESARRLARKLKVPLREIYRAVERAWSREADRSDDRVS
ncbi:nickel pincer cofactor biosynthesis protein LarC [candidate division KSB1 bacterium]